MLHDKSKCCSFSSVNTLVSICCNKLSFSFIDLSNCVVSKSLSDKWVIWLLLRSSTFRFAKSVKIALLMCFMALWLAFSTFNGKHKAFCVDKISAALFAYEPRALRDLWMTNLRNIQIYWTIYRAISALHSSRKFHPWAHTVDCETYSNDAIWACSKLIPVQMK